MKFLEMKITISEMNNTLHGTPNSLDTVKKGFMSLKILAIEII